MFFPTKTRVPVSGTRRTGGQRMPRTRPDRHWSDRRPNPPDDVDYYGGPPGLCSGPVPGTKRPMSVSTQRCACGKSMGEEVPMRKLNDDRKRLGPALDWRLGRVYSPSPNDPSKLQRT